MKIQEKLSWLVGVSAISVAFDQWTKVLAVEHLQGRAPTSYLGDFFRLMYAENRGAFLSLGAEMSDDARFLLFTLMAGVVLIGMVVYVLMGDVNTQSLVIAFSLLISGGASNLVDRVFNNGAVVDFMNMGFEHPFRTGIFNVADVAIMVGVGLILVNGVFEKETQQSVGKATSSENTSAKNTAPETT